MCERTVDLRSERKPFLVPDWVHVRGTLLGIEWTFCKVASLDDTLASAKAILGNIIVFHLAVG